MDAELAALAAAGSSALVQAAATDAWAALRDRVVELFGRNPELREAEARLLDGSREALLAPDGTPARGDAEGELTGELRLLLAQNPRAAAELRRIIEEFEPPADRSSQTAEVTNTLSGGVFHGTVVQAHTVEDLSVHLPPVEGHQIDFSGSEFKGTGPVIGVQNNYGNDHGPQPGGTHSADGWPRVDELRRLSFGVRPTSRFGDEPALPPYVPRDCDDTLGALVAHGLREGGLVVVIGEPLSGKTMTAAWAALHPATGPGTRIHRPDPGTDLRDLPARLRGGTGHYIVWLDDLEGHLGEHGLTAGLLAQLTQERALVLATMRDEAYARHRFGGAGSQRVLAGARTVHLGCDWSAPELGRLADRAAGDPRLAAARNRHGGTGVTEFLSVAPELWEEWRHAGRGGSTHLRGHLLVRAAIDLARCGIEDDIPLELLLDIQGRYAEYKEQVAAGAGQQTPADALAWATAPRHGVTGLLVPGSADDTYRAYGSLVADGARSGELPPLLDVVWVRAVLGSKKHGFAALPAVTAGYRAAFLPRAEGGEAQAQCMLGFFAEDAGDTEEAETWHRKAADRGHIDSCVQLGNLLARRGAGADAIPYLESAAEAGKREVLPLLGRLLQERAVHYLRRAESHGNAEAAARLKGPLVPPDSPVADPGAQYR
ncbi:tetratricopeptide repeat protein [Streptomyces sp. NPDC059009]|uniref:tetratricopeptide repeat protein n=1 Tax=Streptomyces sp. NPDC059009 TaxID=3346694 RepID=UPI003699013E